MMVHRHSILKHLGIVISIVLVVSTAPVAARTDDPQPCDHTAQLLTVITPEAAVQKQPSLHAEAHTSVPNGMLLAVTARHADDAVGCWYQVAALPGQAALPAPAWIAGSTVRVIALAPGTPVPTSTPAPVSPTPNAPYYAPSTPLLQGDPGTSSPASTPPMADPEAVASQVVTTRVCLDRNANTFCDVDEGVAGVPAYVLGPSGQVLAETRSDGAGVVSGVVQVPPFAQLAVNVPYLNAYQRVSGMGETPPILVPISAPIPGLLP